MLWWDGLGDKRGRPQKTSQTADVLQTAESLGLNRATIHRWHTRYKDEGRFGDAAESVMAWAISAKGRNSTSRQHFDAPRQMVRQRIFG